MEQTDYTADRELAVKALEQMDYVHLERGQVAALVDVYRVITTNPQGSTPGHEEELGTLAGLLVMSVGTGVKLVPEDGPPNVRVGVPRLLVESIKALNIQRDKLAAYKEEHKDGGGPIDPKSMEVLEAQQATHRAALSTALVNVIITDLAGLADAGSY